MSGVSDPEQRDDNGEPDSDFGRSHCDNEKNEDLGVIIGQTIGANAKSGKGNKRKIGGVQHQFERHKNDDDVAAQEHASEANHEQYPADDQVIAKRNHRSSRLLNTITPIVATRTRTAMT